MKKIFTEVAKVFKNSKSLRYVVLACGLIVLAVAGFGVYAASYGGIFPNVYIEDVNVGRMTKERAIPALEKAFKTDNLYDRSITLECDGRTKDIKLSQLNTEFDVQKSVQSAYKIGRKGGIFKKTVGLLVSGFKKTKVPIEISLNAEKLNSTIGKLAEGLEVEPQKTSYMVNGEQLIIKKGHGGKRIDREKALEAVKKAAADPKIVKVAFKIEKIEEEPIDVDEFYKELTAPPKNAEYKFEDGEVKVIDEKVKVTVDKGKLKEALASKDDEFVLAVKTEKPEVTAKQLKDMLFRDVLATYSSSFHTSSASRASNVTISAQRINGSILMPGEVFSYDKTIGRRTAENGYKEAGVYVGNKVESGIGGGICQTSSTLYSAALYANLQIVSRTSHSLPVSYVPLGQDATIAQGYIDLKLKNNTDYPIKIVATVNGRRLTCSILGVKEEGLTVEIGNKTVSTEQPKVERSVNNDIPRGYKHIVNKGAFGYTVATTRVVKKNGKVIKTENMPKSVYRAAPIEEELNPADQGTPSENLKVYTPGMVIPKTEEEPQQPQSTTPEPQNPTTTTPEPQSPLTEPESGTETETTETI